MFQCTVLNHAWRYIKGKKQTFIHLFQIHTCTRGGAKSQNVEDRTTSPFSLQTFEGLEVQMEFFCCRQISPAWSPWAWSPGRSPRSRSPHPPSTTPAGRPSAPVSTTRRTAGRPRMTPSGSGYRSVQDLLLLASSLVNNGTAPRGSSSPSLSSAFGVCSDVSALRLGPSEPRRCSHLA